MAQVFNINELRGHLVDLGFGQLDIKELVQWLNTEGVTAMAFFAYLRALAQSRRGIDDQSIPGCSAAQATKITAMLVGKGLAIG